MQISLMIAPQNLTWHRKIYLTAMLLKGSFVVSVEAVLGGMH